MVQLTIGKDTKITLNALQSKIVIAFLGLKRTHIGWVRFSDKLLNKFFKMNENPLYCKTQE